MKLERHTTDQQGMKNNMKLSQNNNYWEQGMKFELLKLEQQLLMNMEWSSDKTIDQQGMKLEQQLLAYREWS